MTEENLINYREVVVEDEMKKSYLDYAMSVIVSRALPDVRDGLKPVQRRILYSMNELGISYDKQYRKSARVVGDVLGKYHPHGDSPVYEAMVRLAQDFNTRYLLVDGHGNFGSVDGDSAAAMRYTEVRMTKIAGEMLRDIAKETVDFMMNFDETTKEPVVLPSNFPNLLVNGSVGIAVGMATNMPPHNIKEIVDACVYFIDNQECESEDLMKFVKGPDFPTGGNIMGREGIKEAYRTGRGKIILRACAEIEEYKNRQRIVVNEIPYQVNKANLIAKIADLVRDKKIEGISDIRDESDRDGLRIVIEIKRDANAGVVLNKLYKNTQMQTTYGIINLALVDGVPKILNLKALIREYIYHRFEIITRRTRFDLKKAEARAHIVEGLKIALDNIDRVISIIRNEKEEKSAKEKLIEEFKLSEIQAQAILDMRLKRLTGLERDKLDEEYLNLIKEINRYKEILSNERLIYEIIKEELNEIKEKYGDLRKTAILQGEGEIDIEDVIQKEDVVITLTHFGYIKRMPEGTYKPQKKGGRGVQALTTREEDFVEDLYITSTHDTLLFFTDFGRVYSLKAYEIPESGRQAKGSAVVNLLKLEKDEKISAIIPVGEFKEGTYLSMLTENGIYKRVDIAEFENIRKKGINAIKIDDEDRLIGVKISSGKDKIAVITKKGMALIFEEKSVRKLGRSAKGVKAISLREGDKAVGMELADDEKDILLITENGFGKKTPYKDFRLQNRGGKGLIAYKLSKDTGSLISAKTVEEGDEIMMITQKGNIIRIFEEDVRELSRNTKGVIVMRMKEDKIVAVAKYVGS